MSGLFATKTGTNFLHTLKDVSVTYFSSFYLDVIFLSHNCETKITHNCNNNCIKLKLALALHMIANNCHNLVSVNHISKLVHSKKSVRITIKCKTDICLFSKHSFSEFLHMSRSAFFIDVCSIWIVMNCYKISAKLLKRLY